MSFDLFFIAKREELPGRKHYRDYFERRKWYRVTNDQAWYENEDTQVYFSFQWSDDRSDFIEEDEYPDEYPSDLLALEFNVNLLRAHVFGLEAAIELDAFVNAFDFLVFDPQARNLAVEAFDKRQFEKKYDRSNKSALIAAKQEHPEILADKYHISRPTLSSIWEWNYSRLDRMESIDFPTFVPLIYYVDYGEGLKTVCLWSDGITTVLPEVDLIECHKYKLAPRRWLRRQNVYCVVPFETFRDLITEYPRHEQPIRHWTLDYESVPYRVRDRFKAIRAEIPAYTMIRLEDILDEELLGLE